MALNGLHESNLAIACEESAGASFLRRDGAAWTTEKDGIVAGLLAAEITASVGADPGLYYRSLTATHGCTWSDRLDAPATSAQRARLAALTAGDFPQAALAGASVDNVQTTAGGNGQPIGGIRINTAKGCVALRPSGTEDIYKLYGESFDSEGHLLEMLSEAQGIADRLVSGVDRP